MEDFIASTRNKSVRSARVTAYFMCGFATICAPFAVFFYFDGMWQLTVYLGAFGVAFAVAGVGMMRVAKRNSEHGEV